MDEAYADLIFPSRGIDLSFGYGAQRPLTTPIATNVRLFEAITERGRGGSRQGLVKYIPTQIPSFPTGSDLVQHLNFVVISVTDSLLTSEPPPVLDPVTGLPPIDDPSSTGPPTSWGTGIINEGPPPITGVDAGSRNPGGPGGTPGITPKKVRDKGSGVQPNKNTLVLVSGGSTGFCFSGRLVVTVTKPPPDPFGWTGQTPSFFGVKCATLFAQPTTALTTQLPSATAYGGTAGMNLLTAVSTFLSYYVGADAYAVVTTDLISSPGSVCTGTGTCSGYSTTYSTGTGVGTVINA